MKEYKLIVKLKNNLILENIEKLGFESIASFCEEYKLSTPYLYNIINFKLPVLTKKNKPVHIIKQLSKIFNLPIEEFLTKEQSQMIFTPKEYNFDYRDIQHLLPSGMEDIKQLEDKIDNDKLFYKRIPKALDSLTSREKKVIEMRFYENMTMRECGAKLGVSNERIRQIEAKALRKLRHPNSIAIIKDISLE